MTTLSVPITSTIPVPIYPNAKQGQVTIFNSGTARAYVSTEPSTLVGIPIDAGNSIQWDAQRPLYAYVTDTANPSKLIILDSGVTLPSTNVTASITNPIGVSSVASPVGVTGITNPVQVYGKASTLTYLTGTGTSFMTLNITDMTPYQSIVVKITSNSPGSGVNWFRLVFNWMDTTNNTIVTQAVPIVVSQDVFNVTGGYEIRLPVIGAKLGISQFPGGGVVSNGASTFSVQALSNPLPARFQASIGTNNIWSGNPYNSPSLVYREVVAAAIQDYLDIIPAVGGKLSVNLFSNVNGVFAIKPYLKSTANAFAINVTNTTQYSFDVVLPWEPVYIYFRPSVVSGTVYFTGTFNNAY